jgi:hypothetical protein
MEGDIKRILKETGCEGVDEIHLAWDMVQLQPLVNKARENL